MKKLIALAVASVVATSANATWNNGVSKAANTNAGELILTVWNTETGKGFVQDLNALTLDYLLKTDKAAKSFTINAEGLAHVGGATAPLRYTVAGLNNSIETVEYPFVNFDNFSFEGFAFTADKKPGFDTDVDNTRNSFTAGIEKVQVEVNRSIVSADGDTYMDEGNYADNGTWGKLLFISANKLGFKDASAAFGESNNFWGYQFFSIFAESEKYKGNDEYQIRKLGAWNVQGNQLTFTAEVAVNEVPVPAAAWLFGSALVGLAGLRRRK